MVRVLLAQLGVFQWGGRRLHVERRVAQCVRLGEEWVPLWLLKLLAVHKAVV